VWLTVDGFAFIIIMMKVFHFICQIKSKGYFPIKTKGRAMVPPLTQVLPKVTFIVDPIDKLLLLRRFNVLKIGIIGPEEVLGLV
jgi:hypothetical protein